MQIGFYKTYQKTVSSLLQVTSMAYQATLLQQCRMVMSDEIETAGVRILPRSNIELIINPEYFLNLSLRTRAGLLYHESMHLILDHIDRSVGVSHEEANAAMDTSLNQYIPKYLLPPGALTLQNQGIPGMEGKPLESWELYYNLILDWKETQAKNKPKNPDGGKPSSGQNAENKKSTSPPKPSQSGQSQPSKENSGENDSQVNGYGDRFDEDQDEAQKSGPSFSSSRVLDDHSKWKDSPASRDSQKKTLMDALETAKEEMIRNHGVGSIPKNIQSLIKEACTLPLIEWDLLLRSAVGRVDFNDYESTRNRPNRRLGLLALGMNQMQAAKVLFMVDESASVSDADRRIVFSEVVEAARYYPDKVSVGSFDTEVNPELWLIGEEKVIPHRKKNGGTSFSAVFKFAEEVSPDLLIILTDGECYDTLPQDSNFRVLWVIRSESDNPKLPGERILITQKDIAQYNRKKNVLGQS